MGSHPLRHKVLLPQLKMIVIILMALLTCGGGQQIPPPDGNTLILRNVIDTLGSLSQQLKDFQVTVEAKFEEIQEKISAIDESQKSGFRNMEEIQEKISAIDESQKSCFRNMEELQQCSTEAQLSHFQELVFKDDCEEGSYTCSDMGTCTDYFNRYECSCLAGYSGDGFTCQDIDECSENNNICGDHSTCRNDPGSYTCTCDKYFKRLGDICQDPVCEPPSLLVSEIGCLTFVEEKMSWDVGKSKCQEIGGRLAEGIHRRHFQALSNHFWPMIPGGYALWVGFRRRQWIHQEVEEEKGIKYEDWRGGDPDGDLEQCGDLYLNPSLLGLGDLPCSSSWYLLCQSLP